MKKKLIFSASCLGLVLILSACGTATNTQSNQSTENRPDRRPDFGQPKTQPEVRGVVKSVVGNEVVVLKVDQAQRASTTASSTDSGTKRLNATQGGGMGMGMGMGGGRPDGENSTIDRTAMLAQIKAMSTGEEKVIIPVGIKMLKSSSDTTNRTMVEANISDVIADKMITIWLDASVTDKKVASFVLIN